MMNLFDNSAGFNDVDDKFVARSETLAINDQKQVTRYNTHREVEDTSFRDSKLHGWNQFELGRKDIIDKAEKKPPSYFRLNFN